jgi:hypothetical protein
MRSWWFYLTVELALARALIGKCLGTIEEKTIVIINIYVSNLVDSPKIGWECLAILHGYLRPTSYNQRGTLCGFAFN